MLNYRLELQFSVVSGGDFDQMARRVVAGATKDIAKELCGVLSHPELERD